MADNEQEQILNIRVNYEDAVRGIMDYRAKIAELNDQLDQLKEAQDAGTISTKEYDAAVIETKNQIAVYNGEVRTLNKEIQNNIKTQEAQDGSLKQLRAQLSNLTKEYDSLSKSERESGARGKELREAINQTTTEIKAAEEATQRYYRNVGNYENAIKNTLGLQSQWFQQLNALKDALSGGFANAARQAGQAVAGVGKQLLALLANPIVAVIAALAAAFMALKEGIQSSEENTRTLQRVLAPFKRILEGILQVIQDMAGWILRAVESAENLAMGMARLAERLPLVGNRIKQVNDALARNVELERERQALEDAARRNAELNAESALKVAKLRARAAEETDPKKRASMLKEALRLEEETMKREKEEAQLRYRNAKEQADHTDNEKKDNEELTRLKVAAIEAETRYYQGTLRIRSQLRTIDEQNTKAAKANTTQRIKDIKDEERAREEAARKEVEAVRQAEDTLIALIIDKREREIEVTRVQYERQIEDLQRRLNTEKNLTESAREAISASIVSITQRMNKELAELEAQASRERIMEAVKAEEERLQLLIEATRKGSAEQMAARMELLRQQQDAAIAEVEASTLAEEQKQERITLIAQAYEQKRTELRVEERNAEIQAIQKDFQARIELESQNAVTQQQLRVEQKRAELETLHQVEGESEQEFAERRLAAQREYNAAEKALVEESNKVQQTRLQAAEAVFGGLSAIMDAFGDENKAAAVASKVLALAEVAINTGKAIAAGVASAMSVPFPANIAAIATTITTVMANIATAVKTINSAKFADGGLVDGGNVTGTGTGKSDSVTAQLSNGESVMTAAATAMFAPMLSTLNQIGGGVPIRSTGTIYTTPSAEGAGMGMITDALLAAVSAMPNPVVSVEEINNTANRVRVIESMAEVAIS